MLEIIWMTCMEGLENVQAQVEEINIQLVRAEVLWTGEPVDVVYLGTDEESAVEPDARDCSDELGIGSSVVIHPEAER